MDESDFDFEFDFLPDRAATATLDGEDEQLLWEDSDPELPRQRRSRAAAQPPEIVKRRRIAAAAAVGLLLLIIIIVVATSGGGGGGGRYRSYASDVSPIAQDSEQAGAALASLSRSTAVAKLDALIQQTVDDVNRLQALTPPATLDAVQAQGLAALDLRVLGLQQLRDAFAAGAGSSTDSALATLVASDRIWDGSVRTPANAVLQARGLGGAFPASTFVADRKALAKKLGALLGTAATATTGAVLKLGDTGPDVVSWQNGLNQWITATGSTTLTPLTADGSFGAGTQAATIALQTAQGLSPDGIVGPSTRQALQNAIKAAKSTPATTTPTLKLGDTGQDVVAWQTKLNQWLKVHAPTQTQLSTDGNFGQGTQTATEQFQTAAGLTPSGQVDAQTQQAMTTALSTSRG